MLCLLGSKDVRPSLPLPLPLPLRHRTQVFGYLFSNDDAVVHLVSQVMPLVASFQVADGLAGSCGGVLRGQGRQHLGAFFNMLAYYVLALPLGITLAFRANYGLQGLWIGACAIGLCRHFLTPTSFVCLVGFFIHLGQVVALFIVGSCEYGVVWLCTDWEYEVERGVRRNNPEMLQVSGVSA